MRERLMQLLGGDEPLTAVVISIVCEEIEPHLKKIEELIGDIVGDWIDPRHECRKIDEEVEAILALLNSK